MEASFDDDICNALLCDKNSDQSFYDLEDATNTNDDIIFPEEIYNLKQGNCFC